MVKISVREARLRLPELLDRAEHGEEVVVVRHGKPVARIVPIECAAKKLPSLRDFTASIGPDGQSSVDWIRKERDSR